MMQWVSQVDHSYRSQEGLSYPVYNYGIKVRFRSGQRWHLAVL